MSTQEAEAEKLRRDLVWNFVGLGVMGICGLGVNALVGFLYGAEILGIFNQVFAAYIFVSQLAVAGVQYSVLKHIAELREFPNVIGSVLAASLLLVLCSGILAAVFFWFVRFAVADFLRSPGVAEGMACAAPGLLFFALNKVILAHFNGMRQMRLFAALQATRTVLIVIGVLLVFRAEWGGTLLPLSFSLAEGVLFLLAAPFALLSLRVIEVSLLGRWLVRHLDFGVRSALGGMLVELNTRVDILMLGFFASDRQVGIYTFAAFLVEGLVMVLYVFRTNYDPLLAGFLARKEVASVQSLFRQGRRWALISMFVLGGLTVTLYPVALGIVQEESEFLAGWGPLAILLLGLALSAPYHPVGGILLQGGRPGLNTMMIAILVGYNIALNAVLIPYWGIHGAALATGSSFVFMALLLRFLTFRAFGIRLR